MDKGGRIKLPNLTFDDEDESIFGIFSLYRRSTLHTSHITELDKSEILTRNTSATEQKNDQIQRKEPSTSVALKSRSRDQPRPTDMMYLKMLRNLSSGSDPREKYMPIKLIDSGAFGHVILAKVKKSEHNKMVAIKIIELDSQPFSILASEVTIMRRIRHENVVSCIDALYVETVGKFWLVMPYVHGSSLTKILINSPLQERQICYTSKQCVNGLDYLHQENIVHRDIKSDNILVDVHGNIKITDFGLSYIFDKNDKKNDLLGSPCWMAPEVVDKKPYDFKIDVWSFGITLLEMIDGDPPYIYKRPNKAIKLVKKNGRPNVRRYCQLSPRLKSFLDACLVAEPNERATSRALLDHNFLECEMEIITPKLIKK